jgi:aspartokinase/homoserine dehydrogenase 1
MREDEVVLTLILLRFEPPPLTQPHISHWVVVDCNVVSDPVATKYPGWLEGGIHILSSNLSGASGSQDLYAGIQVCATRVPTPPSIPPCERTVGTHCPRVCAQAVVEDGLRFTSYTDEACIAPGVPVMRTLEDVLKTGDAIVRIEAMLNPGINVAIDRVCAPNSKPRTYQPPTPGKV